MRIEASRRLTLADEDSLPTRRSLLSRLRDLGDSESWRTFFETYWRLLYNVACKVVSTMPGAGHRPTVIAVARKAGFHYVRRSEVDGEAVPESRRWNN
jgi:hypothetical protein